VKVSVIIPVYKAERFIKKAVLSALEQPETGEVILVEDNSPDGSLAICLDLEKQHDRVKLLRHPERKNHGAGASRNIGIMNSTCEYIAFLDADDFYLPGRFTYDKEVFASHPSADGVYSAIGAFFYDEESKQRHMERMKKSKYGNASLDLTTMDKPVAPAELFETLLYRKTGWIHCNGITLRRSAIDKAGMFDENLPMGQDTDLFFRLSYFCKLYPGRLTEAVALRGVHAGNRILDPKAEKTIRSCRMYMFRKHFLLMLANPMSVRASRYILNQYLDYYTNEFPDYAPSLKRKSLKMVNLVKVIATYPHCLKKIV
jgi:hypothetical protein